MFRSMLKIVSNVSKHLYWKKCFVSYVSKHEKLMFQMFRNIKKCTRLHPYYRPYRYRSYNYRDREPSLLRIK